MSSTADNLLSSDPGKELLISLVKVMKWKLDAALAPTHVEAEQGCPECGTLLTIRIPNPEYVSMGAAEMAAILRLLADNSVTLANIRRGDFGEVIKGAEMEYPFPDGPRAVQ